MLVAGGRVEAHADDAPTAGHRSLLYAVARRGLPNVIEATVVPAVMFFVIVKTLTVPAAMAAVLIWAYAAILRRRVRGRKIPAILMLATLGLTVRTAVGLVSGSTFAYFVQPIATTVALAAVFLGSVAIGRPVIARLAHDFCPLAPDVADRPAVLRLFGGLTLLWAVVHIVTAAVTFGMLTTMPVATFVALKTVACLGVTVAAIVVTVFWALRVVHSERLTFARDAL
jgi:intracellular septation protein A